MIKTYWKYCGTLVECEVLQATGDRCLIEHWDLAKLDFIKVWVDRKDVVFPKYSEYGAM